MLTRCEVGARARQEKIAGASLQCWRAPPGRNSLSLPAPVIPPFSLVLNTNRFLIATQSVAPLHPQLTRLTSPRMRAAVSIFTSQVSPGPFASVAPKSPESLSLHSLMRPTSRSNSPDRLKPMALIVEISFAVVSNLYFSAGLHLWYDCTAAACCRRVH